MPSKCSATESCHQPAFSSLVSFLGCYWATCLLVMVEIIPGPLWENLGQKGRLIRFCFKSVLKHQLIEMEEAPFIIEG